MRDTGQKYEGAIDWTHYTPAPREEREPLSSISVGDMYWRAVSPIRAAELALSRNMAALLKEQGVFAHMRRALPPRDKRRAAGGADEGAEGKVAPPERIVYKDDMGDEFEVTADRKRKLADISGSLLSLGLCPMLVQIWEKVHIEIDGELAREFSRWH